MKLSLSLLTCLLFLLHLVHSAPLYVDRADEDDQYLPCPECFDSDYDKRVKMMSVWARNGMPLSILYLKTKPNPVQAPLILPYRASPSTRGGYNSKIYQANMNKPKQAAAPMPMRRQSVVLPQLFVTYGFDNKKPFIDQRGVL
ncbi:hypothetical protein WDU94_015283 [Cyamophila willieti]